MSTNLDTVARLFSEACQEFEEAGREIKRLDIEVQLMTRKQDAARERVSQLRNELLEAARERYRDQ